MALNLSISQPTASQSIKHYQTIQGARIYQLPLEAFPGFWVYAYLVFVEGFRVLIDTGSGFGSSNQHLEAGLKSVAMKYDEKIDLSSLTHVLITHSHIDHFGGLPFIRSLSKAQIGVHELDQRNITNTDERLAILSLRLSRFLSEAGVPSEKSRKLIQLYKLTKLDYIPGPVDFCYEASGMELGPFKMLHTPGHCAGQVVIRLHDVLFSGDHVLSDISPHQAPEHLVLYTGLGHYLASLKKLEQWATGIRLTLGGHNSPITDLPKRLAEIRSVHETRLNRVIEFLKTPHTIIEVSRFLFQDVEGYNVLLALEESGAHVEYLYQQGILGIVNWSGLESKNNSIPIVYQTLSKD